MKEIVTIHVDKEVADAVQIIQTLKECGAISVSNELACMANLWEKLSDNDKHFIMGMIKGSVVALENNKA